MKKLLLLLLGLISCGKREAVVKPAVKPLIEAVYASGFVISKNEYQIYAQVEGYLAEQLVREGEPITKGQPIFVIESRQQSARYDIARETYRLAKRNYEQGSPVLAEMEAGLASARSRMNFDSINFMRYTNLKEQLATTSLEWDRAKLTYQNSKNEYRLLQSRLENRRNQLRMEYENAQKQLEITREESGRYNVKSEIDGKLFSTTKEKGELVRRGEVLAVAGDAGSFYLKLSVDEMDVNKIKTGQRVFVKIDAFGEKLFEATVDHIYPIINTREQSLRVDASFQQANENFYSGLAAEANIVIRQRDHAIVIARKYVLTGDSVLIRNGDEVQKVKIERGIETLDEVEVLSGLDSSAHLLVRK